jgi:hypothetical protein
VTGLISSANDNATTGMRSVDSELGGEFYPARYKEPGRVWIDGPEALAAPTIRGNVGEQSSMRR